MDILYQFTRFPNRKGELRHKYDMEACNLLTYHNEYSSIISFATWLDLWDYVTEPSPGKLPEDFATALKMKFILMLVEEEYIR